MPIIKSAKKQMRQDERRYAQNLRVKRALKLAVKKFEMEPTFDGLRELQSQIDTAVKKRIIKKNTGARKMKRYSKVAKEAGVKIPAKVAAKKAAAAKPTAKIATKKTAKPAVKKPTKTAVKKPATSKTAAKK